MIFYRVLDADARVHWAGTQADAKAISRNFEQRDIPTDKAGLMELLNAYERDIEACKITGDPSGDIEQPRDEPLSAHDVAHQTYRTPPPTKAEPITDPADVEDFILNRATIGQIENLFARIGTRFAELMKGR